MRYYMGLYYIIIQALYKSILFLSINLTSDHFLQLLTIFFVNNIFSMEYNKVQKMGSPIGSAWPKEKYGLGSTWPM